MNSYQKLKTKLSECERQLNEVVLKPKYLESMVITETIKHKHKFEKMVWAGNANLNNG